MVDRYLTSEQDDHVVDIRFLESGQFDRDSVPARRQVLNPEGAVRSGDRRSNGATFLVGDGNGGTWHRRLRRVGDDAGDVPGSLLSCSREARKDAAPQHGEKQSDAVEMLAK